jgi:hypothetical protein
MLPGISGYQIIAVVLAVCGTLGLMRKAPVATPALTSHPARAGCDI